jgi:type IV secretion system protein VirD4
MNIIEQLFKLLIGIFETVFGFIFEFLSELFTGIPKNNEGYNAEFVSTGTVASRWNYGFCLTGRRNLTLKDSYQNALIVGGTGVGKSSIVLVPSLFTMNASLIVHDPACENHANTGGFCQQKKKVIILNFAKPEISIGYNPLARANSSSEIQKVSSMLVQNGLGGKTSDPFWSTLSVSLLTILISILKKQEAQYQNLFNVRQLLSQLGSNPEVIDNLFSADADEILFAEYKSFIAYDQKVISGVVASCKAALQIFSDESVARVTSHDSINFQEFRDIPTVLYIQNSVADQKYYSVLTSLFFEQFFSFLLSRFPEKTEQDIFLLIDEASSLNLPTLPLAVANVRKHRSGIMLLIQDNNQLIHQYGKYEADSIKANCYAKLYFTGLSLETTKELESVLGKYQYEDEDGKKITRQLMTNDEIRTMKKNRALLICGNHSPIMVRLKPYYKNSTFLGYSKLKPQVQLSISSAPIPILPLSNPSAKQYA